MSDKSKIFTPKYFGNTMFYSGHILFWVIIFDHGDSDDAKFALGGVCPCVVFLEANSFGDLGICAGGIDSISSVICRWY